MRRRTTGIFFLMIGGAELALAMLPNPLWMAAAVLGGVFVGIGAATLLRRP